ncbi:hypothetical protein [Thermogemmatispora aurantia]|uniref:hypothetical protein n=1 Tax=Thermogemmatispora aurantia TaxID=2045279 RepID=UPI00124DD9BE|nr:hypothetical protein [Thermogemmatispora aurantia]
MRKTMDIAVKDQQLLERLGLGRPLAAFRTRRWLRVSWWGLLGVGIGVVVLVLWRKGPGDLAFLSALLLGFGVGSAGELLGLRRRLVVGEEGWVELQELVRRTWVVRWEQVREIRREPWGWRVVKKGRGEPEWLLPRLYEGKEELEQLLEERAAAVGRTLKGWEKARAERRWRQVVQAVGCGAVVVWGGLVVGLVAVSPEVRHELLRGVQEEGLRGLAGNLVELGGAALWLMLPIAALVYTIGLLVWRVSQGLRELAEEEAAEQEQRGE